MTHAANPQVAPTRLAPEPAVFPSQRLLDLYRVLEFKSRIDGQGRRVQENVSHEHLTRYFRVSRTTVERAVRQLEQLGHLRREHDPAQQIDRGRFASTRTRYVLLLAPRATQVAAIEEGVMPAGSITAGGRLNERKTAGRTDPSHPWQSKTAGRTDPSHSESKPQVAPTRLTSFETGQNHGYESTEGYPGLPVGGTTVREAQPEPAPELWPTDAAGNLLPVRLRALELELLDHDPTPAEVLATLRGGLSEAAVVGVVRHDDPDAHAKLAAIASGSLAWPWQDEATGQCPRCELASHTTGPDDAPWHPFCWAATEPPSAVPSHRQRGRGRAADLAACPVGDFHRALDQLDRDTCSNGDRCGLGRRCRRHTRRVRVEP